MKRRIGSWCRVFSAKAGPDNYENAFGFRLSDVQEGEEKYFAKANWLRLQKQTDEDFI